MQNTIATVHKESNPKNLVESYRPLILTSCIGKRLEKGCHRQPEQLGWNLRKKSDRQQNSFKKKGAQMVTYSNYLKQLRYVFHKASFYHRNPSLCREGLWFDGLLFKLKKWVLTGNWLDRLATFSVCWHFCNLDTGYRYSQYQP